MHVVCRTLLVIIAEINIYLKNTARNLQQICRSVFPLRIYMFNYHSHSFRQTDVKITLLELIVTDYWNKTVEDFLSAPVCLMRKKKQPDS